MKSIFIDLETPEQRYPTMGDYIHESVFVYNHEYPEPIGYEHRLKIKVTPTGNWKYNFLIALHEMVEAALCEARGISTADIDLFDTRYENAKKDGEPGDDPDAPYFDEHQVATVVEKLVAKELGIDWNQYENKINEIFDKVFR